MEPISPSKLKLSIWSLARFSRLLKLLTASLLVLLLLLGVYYAFQVGETSFHAETEYYTVVLDCGSTGTRVNVYKWKAIRSGDWGLPVLVNSYPEYSTSSSTLKTSSCKYHCFQTEPGLDRFVGNASAVKSALVPLIRLAEKWVPRRRHVDTPIFVLATAGLRRLQSEDARQVLNDVETFVKEHSFVYRKDWIRILSGKEEAYYGWVALNYRMGRLGNSSSGPTLGLLDLGGSSLQIVTEVDGEIQANENLMKSKVGLVENWILAYSLPSFGLNEAFDRTFSMLRQVQPVGRTTNDAFKPEHPCLSSNSAKLNFRHQTSSVPNWNKCKAVARAVAINSSSFSLSDSMVGSNCKARFSSNNSSSNIFNLEASSSKSQQFHAISGFFAVHNILNLNPRANFTKIWERGRELCSKPLAKMSNKFANKKYARQYCFSLPYTASLIQDLLCLGDREITFGPGDLSWTLGAALVEGNYLWRQSISTRGVKSFGFLKSMDSIHSPVFVFLILICLLIVVYYSKIKLPMLGKKAAGSVVGPSLPSYVYPKQRPN
ncbi:Probable apyrase 7 [Linum perenne]